MKCHKIINLLDNKWNQSSRFTPKNHVAINDEIWGMYDVNNETKFKFLLISSSLCDYSYVYRHFKGTLTIWNTADTGAATNNSNKKRII